MVSFYTEEELNLIGFASIGKDVKLSRKTSIYTPEKIVIGDNTRIDDYCILSGNLTLGRFVHIAASCLLFGGNDGIVFEDYTGLSSRCAIYAESDDYSGLFLTNPTIPAMYRHIIGGGVVVKKHAIIGSGCTILPNVVIGEGTAIGSMSLVNKSLEDWSICIGIPCKKIKERKKALIQLEKDFVSKQQTK